MTDLRRDSNRETFLKFRKKVSDRTTWYVNIGLFLVLVMVVSTLIASYNEGISTKYQILITLTGLVSSCIVFYLKMSAEREERSIEHLWTEYTEPRSASNSPTQDDPWLKLSKELSESISKAAVPIALALGIQQRELFSEELAVLIEQNLRSREEMFERVSEAFGETLIQLDKLASDIEEHKQFIDRVGAAVQGKLDSNKNLSESISEVEFEQIVSELVEFKLETMRNKLHRERMGALKEKAGEVFGE